MPSVNSPLRPEMPSVATPGHFPPPSPGAAKPDSSDEQDLRLAYVGQAVRNTAIIFSAHTVATPLLPPQVRCMTPITMALTYAHLKQRPEIVLSPAPSPSHQAAATGIALFPFIPAFAVHVHVANRYFSGPAERTTQFAESVSAGWKRWCARLPGASSKALADYPFKFIGPRVGLQGLAAALGAATSAEVMRLATDRELARVSEEVNGAPARRPEPYLAAMALFAVPAAFSTSRGAELLARAGPVGATCAMTTLLWGAAVGSSAAIAAAQGDRVPNPGASDEAKLGRRESPAEPHVAQLTDPVTPLDPNDRSLWCM